MLSTPVIWVPLTLIVLQGLALRNLAHPLARCAVSVLLLSLLLMASLPTPGVALQPLLLISTAAVALPLGWSLGRRQQPAGPAERGYLAWALILSLAGGLLVAARPNPFEYPGDAVDYLNLFQLQALVGPRDASCLESSWHHLTYRSACTLWGVLTQGSPLSVNELLAGLPQRLAIGLSLSVLGLSVFRLLRMAGVGAAAAGLYWLLILTGLGNQSIAFVVNHGLQGSALAAAVFVEAVMVMLMLLDASGPAWLRVGVITASLALFLYLQLRLHGVFAMLTLALLVPLMGLMGAWGLLRRPAGAAERSTAWMLLIVGLGSAVLLLSATGSWGLDPSLQSRLVLRWKVLEALGLPAAAVPGSYMLRAPGNRPELLAVASLLAGGWCLLNGRNRATSPTPTDTSPGGGSAHYQEMASLYSVAILLAFLLPPISHIFLNLPKDVISNYRLMWGMVLVSPLPLLLDQVITGPAIRTWDPKRWVSTSLLVVLVLAVLIPVPGGSARSPQLFWSKSRHLLEGPSARVDLLRINQALLPSLLELRRSNGRNPVVLTDELIGSALQGFAAVVRPIDPVRHYSVAEPRPEEAAYGLIHSDLRRLNGEALASRLERLNPKPDVIIQEGPIRSYYTPYAEIRVYDQEAVPHIASSGVNALEASLLTAEGFRPWRTLSADGRSVPQAADEATYWIWTRSGR